VQLVDVQIRPVGTQLKASRSSRYEESSDKPISCLFWLEVALNIQDQVSQFMP